MTTPEDVERHNRRELWRDVENHLTVAYEAIEQAQSALEDLHEAGHAELLAPHVEAMRRAAADAGEQVTS